jgi:hypothetical protein
VDPFKLETTLESDGTLILNQLPFQAGDRVAIVIVPAQAERDSKDRYPLRGSVVSYDRPTAPVDEDAWEANH